jgi:hypothetical protein
MERPDHGNALAEGGQKGFKIHEAGHPVEVYNAASGDLL